MRCSVMERLVGGICLCGAAWTSWGAVLICVVFGGYPGEREVDVACIAVIYGSPVGGNLFVWCCVDILWCILFVVWFWGGYLGSGEFVVATVVVIQESPVGGTCLRGAPWKHFWRGNLFTECRVGIQGERHVL